VYDLASDVRKGPNVYTYVVQNPWTMFDPLGLYYDSEQFDDDGYAKIKEDTKENKQYNERANQFNEEWKKARGTPTGSAMHDYIANKSDDVKFSIDLTANIKRPRVMAEQTSEIDLRTGKGGSKVKFNIAYENDMETIAHEFFHGIQDIEGSKYEKNNPIGPDTVIGDPDVFLRNRNDAKYRGAGDVFANELGYSVYHPSDANGPSGSGISPSKEAQARRIENNVLYGYALKNRGLQDTPSNRSAFVKYGHAKTTYSDWQFKAPMGTRKD